MVEETKNCAILNTNTQKPPCRLKNIAKMCALITIIGLLIFCIFITVTKSKCVEDVKKKPNIVIIMADDLGSYDLSLRGSNQILTPNIDALGYQGIIFNRHYTMSLCGPSRAALLTGKYPIHTGQQHFVILPDEPRGLPLNEKLLPQYLKEAGYSTHIIGKWHLGYARKSYTPTERGFDSHIGFLGGYISYFQYTFHLNITRVSYIPGFDFYRNKTVYNETVGEYATDVLTNEACKVIWNHDPYEGPLFLYFSQVAPHAGNNDEPLEAIPEDLDTVRHIKDPDRRTYAAMVKALDRSVGKLVKALKRKNMLDNTIILFFSDNGGPTAGLYPNTGSNYPLKGIKNSPWEGGIRGVATIWSSLFRKRHYVSNYPIHITDWLPTFAQVTGTASYKAEDIDGYDIWATLTNNKPTLRKDILHNIDPIIGYTSYYYNGWKYVNGSTVDGTFDTWFGSRNYEVSPEAASYANFVMQSDVWQALQPYATKLLRPSDINELRRKTEITCQKQYNLTPCKPLQAPCLFYIDADPCEMNNLADLKPAMMMDLKKRIQKFENTMVPPANVKPDLKADPALNDGLWTWWLEREDYI